MQTASFVCLPLIYSASVPVVVISGRYKVCDMYPPLL